MRKLGIYVQVPFCQTKCTYCNFHTGVVASSRFAPYVEAVCGEIRGHRELLRAAGVDWPGRSGRGGAASLQRETEAPGEVSERPASEGGPCTERTLAADTVYIGGGTPSLLDPIHVQNILDGIRETFGERPASEGGPYALQLEEVTLEADPETIEAGKAAAWVGAGINRVSFGLQSFSDKELVAAGKLGELYYFDSVRINLGLVQRDVNVLWDLAPHDIAILDHLVDQQPASVCANGACHLGTGVENVAYLSVYFDSGLIAHFHNNWLAPVKIRTVIVGGSKQMILYDDMEPSEKIKVYDRGVDVAGPEGVRRALISYRLGDMWAPRLDGTEALRLVAAEFVRAASTGERPLTDGVNGMNVVKILEAAEMSIKHRGREVKL